MEKTGMIDGFFSAAGMTYSIFDFYERVLVDEIAILIDHCKASSHAEVQKNLDIQYPIRYVCREDSIRCHAVKNCKPVPGQTCIWRRIICRIMMMRF
ncbi:MAG: hypothetical protein ACI4ET_02245 [Bilifractor sp.]